MNRKKLYSGETPFVRKTHAILAGLLVVWRLEVDEKSKEEIILNHFKSFKS